MRNISTLLVLLLGTLSLVSIVDASTRNSRFTVAPQNANNKSENSSSNNKFLLRGPDAWVDFLSMNNKDNPCDIVQEPIILSKNAFASGVSFLTGIADVFCFRMNKCYANMLTGNTIKLGSAIGEMHVSDALFLFGLFMMYGLGNFIFRALIHHHQYEDKKIAHKTARSSAAPLALALFAVSDYVFYTNNSLAKGLRGHVMPLALGFGLLNAANTDAMGGTITFAMTGHVSKIAQGIADWLYSERRRFRPKMSARIVSFFFLGVVAGTLLNGAGSQQIVEASGMRVSSYILENNLPIFTIVGAISILLLHLYDRSLPRILQILLQFRKNGLDITVNKWSPQRSL